MSNVPIAAVLDIVRTEIKNSIASAKKQNEDDALYFEIDEVEVELQVVVTDNKETNKKTGLSLSVLSFGFSGSRSKEEKKQESSEMIHRIRLKMSPSVNSVNSDGTNNSNMWAFAALPSDPSGGLSKTSTPRKEKKKKEESTASPLAPSRPKAKAGFLLEGDKANKQLSKVSSKVSGKAKVKKK